MKLKSLKIFYITFWITFLITILFNLPITIKTINKLCYSSICSATTSTIITYLRYKILERKIKMNKEEILKGLHDILIDYSSEDYYKEVLIRAMNFIEKNMESEK
ncbi:MAG: hypothetical protein OSJ63_05520 [Bacilli bacterium]|nr:hypothetical protein [Bacilli bacterium]